MGDEFSDFTLAAVQAAPVYLDREASIEKACGLIQDAADKGAVLAVFGETWVSGYALFATHATHPRFFDVLRRFILNGVEVPSPATDALCAAARKAGIDVAIGIAERDSTTQGTIYCTLLFIGREGEILGRHRKLKPTFFERIVWGEGDGSTLRIYERPYGRLGGLNCWEHQMVLPGYALIAQGLQVHAGVWPGGGDFTRQEILSRAFAMQAGAYVVMTGGLLRPEDIPSDLRELVTPLEGDLRDQVMPLSGNSAIIGPGGDLLAGPLLDEEGILTAQANLGQAMVSRMVADHAGHYTRPDVFDFRVNTAPRRVAEFDERAVERVREGVASGSLRSPEELAAALAEAGISSTETERPS
jgi:predicted amidohydrolase